MKTKAVSQFLPLHLGLGLVLMGLVAGFAGPAFAQSGASRAEPPTIKVGDRWRSEQSDSRTGVKEADFDRKVTSVSASQIEGTENSGKFVWTIDLNVIESSTRVIFSGDAKELNFPLEIGKKWDFKYTTATKLNPSKLTGRLQFEANVTAYEKVKVPAGEFDAFRIEYKGFWYNGTDGRSGSMKMTNWYAPAARSVVKTQFGDGYNNWVRQLTEFQLEP